MKRLKILNVFRKFVLVIKNRDTLQKGEQEKELEICFDQLSRKLTSDEDYDKFTTGNSYQFRALTAVLKGKQV